MPVSLSASNKAASTVHRLRKSVKDGIAKLDTQIKTVNSSKYFAGLIVVILNISSKYVDLKLSKTAESYLKHNFSRNLMVAAICWMGSRDIYIAAFLTVVFIVIMDFLFNEDSRCCIIPKSVQDVHRKKADQPTALEIAKAKDVIERAERANSDKDNDTDNRDNSAKRT